MSSDIPFESVVLSEPLGPVEIHASEKAVQRYCEDWDDPNPLYLDASPFGGALVPPAFQAGLTGFSLLSKRYRTRATVGAKSEHRSVAPAFVGSRLITSGSVVEKYVRRGFEYVVVESNTHDENGRHIRVSRDVILLSLERRAHDAQAAHPPPASRPAQGELATGPALPTLRKRAYQRALEESSFSSNSSHNDDYAKGLGYAGALMSAYVLCGYVSEPLVKFFGPSWFLGGWFSVAFINGGVQQGDPISLGGQVRTSRQGPDGVAHELEVWIEKADGKRVVTGRASGERRPS